MSVPSVPWIRKLSLLLESDEKRIVPKQPFANSSAPAIVVVVSTWNGSPYFGCAGFMYVRSGSMSPPKPVTRRTEPSRLIMLWR